MAMWRSTPLSSVRCCCSHAGEGRGVGGACGQMMSGVWKLMQPLLLLLLLCCLSLSLASTCHRLSLSSLIPSQPTTTTTTSLPLPVAVLRSLASFMTASSACL